MKEKLNINTESLMASSTPMVCPNPDCDSELFAPTTRVRRVSPIMTKTGKPGIVPIQGPIICVKCNRALTDKDFEDAAVETPETPK